MFPIFVVPPGAAELSEQMGTKFKFWYQDERYGQTLFKEGRPGTGENWAEKLAAEFAELLGIPHAQYDLAEWQGRQGVISPSVVPEGARLIHGNELVGGKVTVPNQDGKVRHYSLRNHIATRVFQFLKQNEEIIHPPQTYVPIGGVHSSLGVFVGYLLFDAWISNQDRHSENWALVRTPTGIYLSPSYDHGSSLGRNESDERRQTILKTKDKGSSMAAYVCRARSAFYPNAAGDTKVKAYLTFDLFALACKMDPVAGRAWLERLARISDTSIEDLIAKVPASAMSSIAREFTAKLLRTNIDRLIV
jgi:hypothetical protein